MIVATSARVIRAAAIPPAAIPPAPVRFIDRLAIAADRCKGCGLCVHACPKDVLVLDTTIVNGLGYHPVRLVDAAGCTSCALCARVCPDAVFTVFAPPKAVPATGAQP